MLLSLLLLLRTIVRISGATATAGVVVVAAVGIIHRWADGGTVRGGRRYCGIVAYSSGGCCCY